MIQTLLPICQLLLTSANIIILMYAFIKFLSKPHNTLDSRVTILEAEIKEIKDSLTKGDDKFRDQENTNEVLINSVLALIEFEIQYCLVEHKEMSKGLEKAKENLHNYLSRK